MNIFSMFAQIFSAIGKSAEAVENIATAASNYSEVAVIHSESVKTQYNLRVSAETKQLKASLKS